jgi:hypothetical protein
LLILATESPLGKLPIEFDLETIPFMDLSDSILGSSIGSSLTIGALNYYPTTSSSDSKAPSGA